MPKLIPMMLTGLIFLPFAGAALIFILGNRGRKGIVLAMSSLLPLLSFMLAYAEYQQGPGRYRIGGWGAPLGIDLVYDGLSVVMLLLSAFIGACVSLYSLAFYRAQKGGEHCFWPLWLIAWGGLHALFLSGDIFNIYVTLEVMTFSAIGLVLLKGSTEALLAGGRYLFFTLLGSLAYLLGVALIYAAYGALDIASLGKIIEPEFVSIAACALITAGLSVKVALFPLHYWLPSAHANAPSPVSAILSSLVITAPFYLLVRLWFAAFASVLAPLPGQMLGFLGTIAIFWGAFQALKQKKLKLLVAYSTVAQIGYMFLLFPLCTTMGGGEMYAWSGGIYFAVSHALAKAAAFLAAGSIVYMLGHDEIDRMDGLARACPLSVFAFALGGMNLIGLPPSGGFVAKWLLLKSALYTGQWLYAFVILAGGLLSAVYFFRVIEITLRKPTGKYLGPKPPRGMEYASLVPALAAICLGLAANIPLEMLKTNLPVTFELPKEFNR